MADATRWYMISNANPWDNLKFDLEGIAEVRRKFFGTFTIPRSLVVLIDGFKYDEAEIPLKERPEDRSMDYFRMNTLIKDVDGFMLTTSLQKQLVLFLISYRKT
jgi:isoleucyl-tRNA synthetase